MTQNDSPLNAPTPPPASATSRDTVWHGRATKWIPLLVAVVTLVAVGRLCAMDFTWWDDNKTIHHNPHLNPPSVEGVLHYWKHAHMSLYVPVTYTVWSGLATVARVEPDDLNIALNPWVFHSANVLVHVINTLVVYAILKMILRRPWAAAAGAMIFGVHPVQVEPVGWASGMKDLLCGMFVLLAVWQYLLFAVARRDGGKRAGFHYGAAALFMVLGMLSKPTAVVTPWLVGVLDLVVVGRPWRAVAKSVGVLVALTIPCMVWSKLAQTVPSIVPLWARPMIAGDALAFYLWKLVWPAHLMVDYGRNPAYVMGRSGWWLTGAVPVAVAAAVWLGRRKRPLLLAAFLVFVVGVSPVLGLTPFEFQHQSTTADHYLYLSMFGVALAVAYAVSLRPGRVTAVCVGLVVAVLAVRSEVQAGVWRNSLTLFRHELTLNPNSEAGHINMAIQFEDRAELEPSNRQKLLAAAERHLRWAASASPDGFLPNRNLGVLMIKQGNTTEAIGFLERAIPLGEADPRTARDDLGFLHYALGAALWQHGRREDAVAHFEKALEYDPASKKYSTDLEVARQAMKRLAAPRAAGLPATTTPASP